MGHKSCENYCLSASDHSIETLTLTPSPVTWPMVTCRMMLDLFQVCVTWTTWRKPAEQREVMWGHVVFFADSTVTHRLRTWMALHQTPKVLTWRCNTVKYYRDVVEVSSLTFNCEHLCLHISLLSICVSAWGKLIFDWFFNSPLILASLLLIYLDLLHQLQGLVDPPDPHSPKNEWDFLVHFVLKCRQQLLLKSSLQRAMLMFFFVLLFWQFVNFCSCIPPSLSGGRPPPTDVTSHTKPFCAELEQQWSHVGSKNFEDAQSRFGSKS